MNNNRQERLWTPLKSPLYRRLFGGQLLSDLAGWLDFLVISATIVYAWELGPSAVAALSVCIGLPWVTVGPFMSVRSGRYPGRTTLIICNLLRAAIVLALLWAPNLAVLLPLVFLKGAVSSIFDPVRQTAVRRLVEPDKLLQVSSLSQMSVSLTKIIGPAAGGLLLTAFGRETVFASGSALYLCSALLLARLPVWDRMEAGAAAEIQKPAGEERPSLRFAWSAIRTRPELKAAIFYSAATMFLIFLYDGLLSLFVKGAGMDESRLGLLIGAVGGGSVIGALAAGHWNGWKRQPLGRMATGGLLSGLLIGTAGAASAAGLLLPFPAWFLLFAAMGFTGAMGMVPFGFILQSRSTPETIAPISALSSALQTGSMLIAPALGAFAASLIGTSGVFAAAGAVMVAAALLFRSLGSAVRQVPDGMEAHEAALQQGS